MSGSWYAALPRAARATLERISNEPRVPRDELRKQVQKHMREIESAARGNEFIDLELAGRLATACESLLDLGPLSRADERAAQAAIRYFVLKDDADDDLASIVGLEDDVEVLNAVFEHLNHPELTITP